MEQTFIVFSAGSDLNPQTEKHKSVYWSKTVTRHLFSFSLATDEKESHYELCLLCVRSEWITHHHIAVRKYRFRLMLMLFTPSTLFIRVRRNNIGKSVHFSLF